MQGTVLLARCEGAGLAQMQVAAMLLWPSLTSKIQYVLLTQLELKLFFTSAQSMCS